MVDWANIQIEYETGTKPNELAEKYGLNSRQISDKAYKDNWKSPKELQARKVEISREKYNVKISRLIDKSFSELEKILNNEDAKDSDKINAVKCVIDISGLKKESQEITNTTPQIVVANETDLKALEELKNADINKRIS